MSNEKLDLKIDPYRFNDLLYFDKLVSEVMVYDLSGQILFTIDKSVDEINLKFLNEGCYLLKVIVDNQIKHIKIIKI